MNLDIKLHSTEVILWYTGTPDADDRYIVQLENGQFTFLNYRNNAWIYELPAWQTSKVKRFTRFINV
jgi:hypothetical protein